MTDYVSSALFVHSPESAHLRERLHNNSVGTSIKTVAIEALLQDTDALLADAEHVVVSGSLNDIKTVFNIAMRYSFSIGLLPTDAQKNLSKYLDLPKKTDKAIELALSKDTQVMDLVLCNGKIVLFKATIGWIPMLDAPAHASRFNILAKAINKFKDIKLLKFQFTTANEQAIKTAASGCMIIQHYKGSLVSKLFTHDTSNQDENMSLLVVSPISIVEYISFLFYTFSTSSSRKRLPNVIGYIKSGVINVESESQFDVFIDGERATQTPLHCEVIPKAIQINLGPWFTEENNQPHAAKESIKTDNLPNEKEIVKAVEKKIPFFSYASEDRFRELFKVLREDARINNTYLVLMLLSTMLATIGLYLNSSAVIIGAMLLAPLMTPIVSAAMGILRRDEDLLYSSVKKIAIGIIIALLASSLIAVVFPHKGITAEMEGRISPSLLDLAVAIISGIAAAYSKSFREIIQNLAGVAIAVALVPPLAVAGIGLGRVDFVFFLQAMLLFSTNLIGIIFAATFTFRILGYSPVVRSRRSLGFIFLSLLVIAFPLYFSSQRIIKNINLEKNLQTERFLVNGKYLMINNAKISYQKGKEFILMEIMAREPVTRLDLIQFKKKIQANFDTKLNIRTKVIYIL